MQDINPMSIIERNPDTYPADFATWLQDNLHVWRAFVHQATAVVDAGFDHYSARTIVEVLRHHTALTARSSAGWKLNDHCTAYLARLFAACYPAHAKLFAFRSTNLEKQQAA
jgi:hypothetical protein